MANGGADSYGVFLVTIVVRIRGNKTVEYLSVCFYRGEVLVRGTLRGRTMDRYLSPGDGHFED